MWWWGVALTGAVDVAGAVDIEVREDPDRDRWTVVWRFDEPVHGIVFTRNERLFRGDEWRSRGGRLVMLDDREALLSRRGRTTSLAVTFSTLTGTDETRELPLNVAFGDGSRLLYTGYLEARPLTCPEGGSRCRPYELQEGASTEPRYAFTTTSARHVAVPGTHAPERATWEGGDVFAYFGGLTPEGGEGVMSLVDPGTPAWVRELHDELLPRLMEHFGGWTGVALSFEPSVMVSYTPEGEAGEASLSGGAVGRQLQLELIGEGWAEPSEEARQRYARFLAREAFHLWNGAQFTTWLGASEAWLTEGSADLLSIEALQELGVFAEADAHRALRDMATACAPRLAGGPLLTAPDRYDADAFYDCSALVLATLGFGVRDRTQGASDLRTVLAQVWAGAKDGRYSTWDVLQAAQEQSRDPMVAGPAERILRQGLDHDAALPLLAEWLDQGGVPTEVGDAWKTGDPALWGELVHTVAMCDCEGHRSVENRGDVLAFRPRSACDVLRDGVEASHIAGVPVTEPAKALGAVWAQIDAGQPFTITDGERTLEVPCPKPPRRPQACVERGGD